MIVTRTPLRITLGGGGTDLPSFYRQHGGFILAMTVDKYIDVSVAERTDDFVVLNFGSGERAASTADVKDERTREALRAAGYDNGIEVTTRADLPSGTGLGSSGAYLVGLLHALHKQRGKTISAAHLAEAASHIEMETLGLPVGKQDAYVTALGGLTVLRISPDGEVTTEKIAMSEDARRRFAEQNHLYYTGVQRNAADVLQHQNAALESPATQARSDVTAAMLRIRDIGLEILDAVTAQDFTRWGDLTHQHWCEKRKLSKSVSFAAVDELYEQVRERFGVRGGKIIGAGGGGFLLLYTEGQHTELEQFMSARGMPRVYYQLEQEGSRVLQAAS